jgi:hypothetical protein
MRVQIEINETDLRAAVLEFLNTKYPQDILTSFRSNDFEVKMTYRENEAWRTPKYLRFTVDRHTSLT